MEQAIWSGNDQLIIEMIKHYQTFPGHWSVVDICIAKGKSFEIVKMLLDSGLDINHDHGWNNVADASETVLSAFASANDDPRVIQLLIDHGAKVNTEAHTPSDWPQTLYQFSSVFDAAAAGKAGNLRVLIENGGNIHLTGFLTPNVTPLIAAAESGSHECVELLLNAGANVLTVDDYEATALMMAAKSGNEKSVSLLLKAGAGKHINAKNRWGSTALIEAAISGNAKSVQALIAAGADVNMGTYGDSSWGYTQWYLNSKGLTALMLASTSDVVKTLIAAGANVNIKDSHGNNAIYYQCFFYRNTETIAALIKAGSYLYLDVNKGRDLLRLSRSWSDWKQNDEIIAMLEKAGCADDNPNEDREPYFYVDRH
jgi:ankyrin repeat protein